MGMSPMERRALGEIVEQTFQTSLLVIGAEFSLMDRGGIPTLARVQEMFRLARRDPHVLRVLDAVATLLTAHAEEEARAEKELQDTIDDARESLRGYERS